ncbi:hypothetical protein INT47_010549 [Mucor saturninus]|uniref:Isopenicillin N synthase-like Fe(2+) 2OG dioxygenase domain-containing protein n=1 Tax=Mucor saturninus TaxID=64648 RepID=A0A8H7QVZ1_9FUNG|nr:hypothetical protein INT47_010549 [Mucor saturninus]
MDYPRNAGWENQSQGYSSGSRESMQFSFHNTSDLRPSEKDVPGLDYTVETFMLQCNNLSQQLLVCFAIGLGFPQDFFKRCHDISQPDCLNSLRCIRYAQDINQTSHKRLPNIEAYRTEAHTNINTFSLLFQQPGQDGLEIYHDNEWTSVTLNDNEIICNIGDMIVRWSDDRLQSRSHRIRNQASNKYHGSQSFIEYVNEANRSVIIQGRTKYTKPITAGEFLMTTIEKNYIALKAAHTSSSKPNLNSPAVVIV